MTHSLHRVGFIGLLVYPIVAAVLAQSDVASSPASRFSRAQIEQGSAITAGVPGGPVAAVTAFAGPRGAEVLASLHRTDDAADTLAFWSRTDTGFRLARLIAGPDDPTIGHIEGTTRFEHEGHVFLHATIRYAGTGGLREDHILRIAPNSMLERVEFVPATDWFAGRLASGEGIWKGASYTFTDSELTFEFAIWNKDDANCCPTAGRVTGTYAIAPLLTPSTSNALTARWRMTPDRFVRHAAGPDVH